VSWQKDRRELLFFEHSPRAHSDILMTLTPRGAAALLRKVSRPNCSRCFYSSIPTPLPQANKSHDDRLFLLGQLYPADEWTNISRPIIENLSRKLHLREAHPIGILREIIEARFPQSQYSRYRDLPAIVSTKQNFDSLGIPIDHPGRSRTDTYYVNEKTVLRTHTSAHQAETFRSCPTPGFLISADVYRRDTIDKSHYPSFHQMEGGMVWTRTENEKDLVNQINKDIAALPKLDLEVDPTPPFHDKNPKQPQHTTAESIAISTHLKRTLEGVVEEIFGRARLATDIVTDEKLRVRWIDAYFPFTSPSYELEVFWEGEWLELLGCGVVTQSVLENAGMSLI
jgi:phenylalanyl-tRNA synthetase alpha chain